MREQFRLGFIEFISDHYQRRLTLECITLQSNFNEKKHETGGSTSVAIILPQLLLLDTLLECGIIT